MLKDKIQELMDVDPLEVAEKIMGKSYKEDNRVSGLGLLVQLDKSHNMRALMDLTDDTKFSEDMENHLRISKTLGFNIIYQEDKLIENKYRKGDSYLETFYVLWHNDGILMVCDTYCTKARNSATIYYNLESKGELCDLYSVISSGHYAKDRNILIGNHDAREGLRHNINKLRAVGNFLPVWIDNPRPWISPYWDTSDWKHGDGVDYKGREAIRESTVADRIAKFPQHVREAILVRQP